tara:strand:- start:3705 stop:7679 length:3975 start_codon:yes stop_codon:yes gene_type:complete
MSTSTMRLGGALSALSAALSVRQLVRYTDTWKRVTNQLRVVEKGSAAVARAQEKVFKISQDTRQSLEGTVALYTRMKRAQDTLKITGEELETVVVAINKGVAASGATTKEAEAGIIQLSQAFISGKLGGDELRSVMENIPIIAKAMAEGLGIPFAEFRAQAAKLKPEQLARGLLKSADDLGKAFGRTSVTIGQAFQMLENAVVKTFGQIDESLKLSNQFAEVLAKIGRNMDQVTKALGALGGAFAVIASGVGFKMMFAMLRLVVGGAGAFGKLAKVMKSLTVGAGAYMGYQAGSPASPYDPRAWFDLDKPVRTGEFSRETGVLGPKNEEGARIRRNPGYQQRLARSQGLEAVIQPNQGLYDVTRRDYLKAFVLKLKDVPALLGQLVDNFFKIVAAVFKTMATLIAEQFSIVMEKIGYDIVLLLDMAGAGFKRFFEWLGRQLGELFDAISEARLPKIVKALPADDSFRDRMAASNELYHLQLKQAEDKAASSLRTAVGGLLTEFTAFWDDLKILADEVARKRSAAVPPMIETVTKKDKPFDWKGVGEDALKALDLLGTALAGVNPQLEAMIAGVTGIIKSLAQKDYLTAGVQAFNLLLVSIGASRDVNTRLIDALERTASATKMVTETLRNLTLQMQELTRPQLEKRAELGKRLREMVTGVLEEGLDWRGGFKDLGTGGTTTLRELGIDNVGDIARAILMATRSEFRGPMAELLGMTARDLTIFVEELKDAFEGLPFGAPGADFEDLLFDPLVEMTENAQAQLLTFGDVIPDSFRAAVERFRHETVVEKPLGDAIIALFKETFASVVDLAGFDWAVGASLAGLEDRLLVDLTGREFSALEEMIVEARLDAAREGANKLIAGYRSLEEMEAAERFQADIVGARSTLATQFGRAGGDVFLQRAAIAEFTATLGSIRDSITLARGRATGSTGSSGTSGAAGKAVVGDGGGTMVGDPFGRPVAGGIKVDLSGGDRVDIVRHALDEFSEIFDGAVMEGTARMSIDLTGDAINIVKRRLTDLGEVLRGAVMDQTAILDLDLTGGYMSGGRINITKYSIDALDEVFSGPVMLQTAGFELDLTKEGRVTIHRYGLTSLAEVFKGLVISQEAPFLLDLTRKDRVTIKRYGLTSLADVFEGKVIDQTAGFLLNMNAGGASQGSRVTINRYPLTSLADVFTGAAIDQTAGFELDLTREGRVDIKRRHIAKLDEVFDFTFNPMDMYQLSLGDKILIDPKKITSIGQVLDLSGVGAINLTDFVTLNVDPHDFFFMTADQTENIRIAIQAAFGGVALAAKAEVKLTEFVDFTTEDLRANLFAAINEGFADREIVIPGVI